MVVTPREMRSCDRYAIRTLGIPGALLMENAGRRVAEVAARLCRYDVQRPVVIICGRGNNAGDGLVAARHLLSMGLTVDVLMVLGTDGLKGETKLNHTFLHTMSGKGVIQGRFRFLTGFSKREVAQIRPGSVVIDALFGTGFRGRVKGPAKKAIEWMNRQSGGVISVDVPSGLDADNGSIGNVCARADITVTMGLRKTGLVTGKGPEVCGRLQVAGLGFSPDSLPVSRGVKTRIVRFEDFRSVIPRRPFNAHKHSVGKILVIAGSVGLTGAAALTATAAMKAGAGAVVLGVPHAIYPLMARKLTEVMVKPIGRKGGTTLTPEAFTDLQADFEWADVIIVGPGIGRGSSVTGFLQNLFKINDKRFLVDADGLNTLAATKGLIRRLSKNKCIFTPHPGEFSRLTGYSSKNIEMNRIEAARDYAKRYGICLVLKGAPTVTALPDGEILINSTGNEGMASAGMGDVLSGIIGGLWAETDDIARSAYAGVYLHGMAGDRAAERLGRRSITASNVISEIPYILTSATP